MQPSSVKRVALLISSLGRGGAERQLMRLASGLVERGVAVEVWCYGGATPLDEELCRKRVMVRTGDGGSRNRKVLLLRGWMAEFQPNVMHGFMKRASSLAVLARGLRRSPVVIGSDLSTATYGKRDFTLWSALGLFAFTQCVATQTELNRRSLERLAPWLRGKVRVIRNGLDLARFEPPTRFPPASPFRFASVGSVYAVKNPVRLVEAVALLRERGRDAFVVDWYGRLGLKGDQQPSEDYHQCCARISELNLQPYFHFHGETADIASAYRRSHALIHPSIQEGFPNAVVEGMACGLPVLVSRVSDLPLVVEQARNGYVFDETSPVAMAESMSAMLDTTAQQRTEMGKRSRELVESWFGLERFVDEYLGLYRELLENKAA